VPKRPRIMDTSTSADYSGRLDSVIVKERCRVAALRSEAKAAVSNLVDDHIVDFANAQLEVHRKKQGQKRVLVYDTVAGNRFSRFNVASTLDHGGTTYDFASDETRREFEKRHGLRP
jgi:NADPH:quinone reductase-like Zn-dependent oxidoreductase